MEKEFEAFDFTELLDALLPDLEGTEEERVKLFRKTLNAFHLEEERPKESWVPVMRKWLAAFTEEIDDEDHEPDYATPLFRGLAQIEHDWTFAKYFSILIENMWT